MGIKQPECVAEPLYSGCYECMETYLHLTTRLYGVQLP
jgi:hypothetical protein